MRERLGIKANGQVVVEDTAEGVLPRPGVTVPVEVYSEERLAEFARKNESELSRIPAETMRFFSTPTFCFPAPWKAPECKHCSGFYLYGLDA